jgi:hypothetical protein
VDCLRLSRDAEGVFVKVSTANTPIPPPARPIVERVHRRYVAACNRGERPAIGNAANQPLTLPERIALAECGYYPIPPQVILLGTTPAEYERQQLLDAVAEQLPEAIRAALETMEI